MYQPLRDWTKPLEQDLAVWLRLVATLVISCHTCMIRLTSLLLKMLLSCTVTRGIWRFQPLIFDDTENTACSAMTSPYRQGVNSYIVHFHSLFQAFRTLRELDIMYSLSKIFYQHIAIRGEHYLPLPEIVDISRPWSIVSRISFLKWRTKTIVVREGVSPAIFKIIWALWICFTKKKAGIKHLARKC